MSSDEGDLREQVEDLTSKVDDLEDEVSKLKDELEDKDNEIYHAERHNEKLSMDLSKTRGRKKAFKNQLENDEEYTAIGEWMIRKGYSSLYDIREGRWKKKVKRIKREIANEEYANTLLWELAEESIADESEKKKEVKQLKQTVIDIATRAQLIEWTKCGIRLCVVKDIRKKIARMVWDTRKIIN